MKRAYIPLIAFLGLILLTIPFSIEMTSSVTPGWHTTIYSPEYFYAFVLMIVLVFAVIGYWLVINKADKLNWIIFIIHALLSISTLIFIKNPSIFLNYQNPDDERFRNFTLLLKLIPWAHRLFVVGQIIFLIYFIRVLRKR
jgi:predicted membrane channel-forming protein YqfA (hemolysin III family)